MTREQLDQSLERATTLVKDIIGPTIPFLVVAWNPEAEGFHVVTPDELTKEQAVVLLWGATQALLTDGEGRKITPKLDD